MLHRRDDKKGLGLKRKFWGQVFGIAIDGDDKKLLSRACAPSVVMGSSALAEAPFVAAFGLIETGFECTSYMAHYLIVGTGLDRAPGSLNQ